MQKHKDLLLLLSLLLSVLMIAASLISINDKDFYASETLNWETQSVVQDWVDLYLISPALLLSSIFAHRGHRFAKAAWLGTLFYTCYTFTIYCFDVHFNKLFLIYCLVLGLSFYLSLYAVLNYYRVDNESVHQTNASKTTAWYFIVVAVIFYGLWLLDIIPAIWKGTSPKTITEAGLPTNAVHVIDLSILLPAIGIIGLLLLKQKPLGFLLAPSLLVFFVLMDVTIAAITIVMMQKGFPENVSVAVVMIVLAFTSLMMCSWFLRSHANQPANEKIQKDCHNVPAAI